MSYQICFIGAGNLATHLALEFQKRGHNIVQVYSRTENSAKTLANSLEATYTTSVKDITLDADIYIVALKDSVINEVLTQINLKDKLIVHCSGSMPLSILEKFSNNSGVFYPLQTFSKKRKVDFKKIPVFIEANKKENEKLLLDLACEISNSVRVLESEKRKGLHIAAVFACNFSNHCYALAAEFLETKNLSFDVLKPLILETAQKTQEIHPKKAQTGPAIRFDENIISDHLNELKELPVLKELYNSISKSIFEHHQKEEK